MKITDKMRLDRAAGKLLAATTIIESLVVQIKKLDTEGLLEAAEDLRQESWQCRRAAIRAEKKRKEGA